MHICIYITCISKSYMANHESIYINQYISSKMLNHTHVYTYIYITISRLPEHTVHPSFLGDLRSASRHQIVDWCTSFPEPG